MKAWYLSLPLQWMSAGGREVIGHDGEEGQEHNLRIKRPGCLDIWNTCSAKLLKLHKETKKQHQLKSTENGFPLGQGAGISGWPELVRPLGFSSELTQGLLKTWIVMRATLWGREPPAYCETTDTTISEQKQRQQACCHSFWRTHFSLKESMLAGGKRAVFLGEQCLLSLCVWRSLHQHFPSPILSFFPSTDIS